MTVLQDLELFDDWPGLKRRCFANVEKICYANRRCRQAPDQNEKNVTGNRCRGRKVKSGPYLERAHQCLCVCLINFIIPCNRLFAIMSVFAPERLAPVSVCVCVYVCALVCVNVSAFSFLHFEQTTITCTTMCHRRNRRGGMSVYVSIWNTRYRHLMSNVYMVL